VDKDVEADLLLPPDRVCRGLPQEGVIFRLRELALGIGGARLADVFRLRERADRCRRKGGQAMGGALYFAAQAERSALGHVGRQRFEARLHFFIVNERRGAARCGGARRGAEFGSDVSAAIFKRPAKRHEFLDLLNSKGEP
jgi:hypothetical protein